jgi:ribosomal-protein-alanine N-acetyltransferase
VNKPVARIRPARPADAAALLALEQHFPGDRMSARSVRRLLSSASARIWVAERAGEVLGALILLSRRSSLVVRIYSLVVAPAARGTGLARRLVATAERAARAAKKNLMRLEVRADNQAARQLYARLGYREEQSLPAYYEDGADGLRLGKLLRARAP